MSRAQQAAFSFLWSLTRLVAAVGGFVVCLDAASIVVVPGIETSVLMPGEQWLAGLLLLLWGAR